MTHLNALAELLATHNWAKAEQLLKRTIAKKHASPDIFYNLGKVLEAAGKYAQSGRWFEKATAAKPDYAMAWFELGRWQLNHHQLRSALTSFKQASALEPADKDARRNVARLALRLGEWENALAASAGFDDVEALQARYRIAVETNQDARTLLAELLKNKEARPLVLKMMTRTAKGCIPLRINAP